MNPILEEIEKLKKELDFGSEKFSNLKEYNPKFESKKEEEIEELLFSGGAGAIAFQAGYVHALI